MQFDFGYTGFTRLKFWSKLNLHQLVVEAWFKLTIGFENNGHIVTID